MFLTFQSIKKLEMNIALFKNLVVLKKRLEDKWEHHTLTRCG